MIIVDKMEYESKIIQRNVIFYSFFFLLFCVTLTLNHSESKK